MIAEKMAGYQPFDAIFAKFMFNWEANYFIRIQMHSFFKHSLFGICYIIISLLVGEIHPFSRETMYDSFPNLAVTFYLNDSAANLLPVKKYFAYNTDAITHNYHNIEEIMGYQQVETKQRLQEVGRKMWLQIMPRAYPTTDTHGITIHRVSYFMVNNSLQQNDEILYQVP